MRYTTEELANRIYKKSLKMALDAGKAGAHIGGSLSCVEIFAVLYNDVLKYNVLDPLWQERDRLIVSKAHCILSHFATLAEVGYYSEGKLSSFLENDGLLCGHPYNPSIGLEFSGGSLGMGISVATGMALAAKRESKEHQVYVLLGDGEMNEGSVWETLMFASQYNLNNFTVIVDYNNMQFDNTNETVMSLAPLGKKLESFGFSVIEVNGHNIEELQMAFKNENIATPRAVIAHTIKARGVSRIENRPESHQIAINEDDYQEALAWREALK